MEKSKGCTRVLLTCVHALSKELFGYFKWSYLFRLNLTVEQRVKLRQHSSLDHIDSVDLARIFRNYCGFFESAASERVEIIAWVDREVHF